MSLRREISERQREFERLDFKSNPRRAGLILRLDERGRPGVIGGLGGKYTLLKITRRGARHAWSPAKSWR